MALHRDIHWIGRQWAVTGYGMQLIDQKLKGFFDIEAVKLWDDGLIAAVRAREWLNAADFDKGLAIARARYPQSSGIVTPPPPAEGIATMMAALDEPMIAKPDPVVLPKPAPPKFQARFAGSAKFVRSWRVMHKR